MPATTGKYPLLSTPEEIQRLRLQALIWEPEAERLLDHVGIQPGWQCLDIGCGVSGILGPLSRRVGLTGRVVGVEIDPQVASAARMWVQENSLENVEILERDVFADGLPPASFNFVHERFLLAPLGRIDQLVETMLALLCPGGVLALQEPDAGTSICHPYDKAWDQIIAVISAAFAQNGGDFSIGKRLYSSLRQARLQEVAIRAGLLALGGRHPYKRWPVQYVESLRPRILGFNLLPEPDLEEMLAECEAIASDPETYILTFSLMQAWGRKM